MGVWIEQPAGTHLDIVVKHPISKKMIPAHQYIIVPDKKGKIRIQAPFYIEEKVKLQEHQGTQGNYRRKTHQVKRGETLTSIAKHYGTDWQVLFQLNKDKIDDPDEIREGQVIKVPPKNSGLRNNANSLPDTQKIVSDNYTVRKGDTLSEIANRCGKSVSELQQINNISNPNQINEGQIISTKSKASSSQPEPPRDCRRPRTLRQY